MEAHYSKRLQIITLAENTSKSMREIASDLGISHSTVVRTLQRYREEGDYTTNYENCGRTSTFDDRDLRTIRRLSVQSPRSTANEIQHQTGASGDCSLRTFQRSMVKAGLKVINPKKRPFLTDTQKK